jgi:hypothetical protein
MQDRELVAYIEHQIVYGAPADDIRRVLTVQGWGSGALDNAFTAAETHIQTLREEEMQKARPNVHIVSSTVPIGMIDVYPQELLEHKKQLEKDNKMYSVSTAIHSVCTVALLISGAWYVDIARGQERTVAPVVVESSTDTQTLPAKPVGSIEVNVIKPKEISVATKNWLASVTALGIVAEKHYDSHSQSYRGLCDTAELVDADDMFKSAGLTLHCQSSSDQYIVAVDILTDTGSTAQYCIDSYGYSGYTEQKLMTKRCR